MKTTYGIIGDGRMASHMIRYLCGENIPWIRWSRKHDSLPPQEKLAQVKRVLLLISDDAILPFYKDNPWLKEKECVHFSGALHTDEIPGMHPLMTFTEELYSLETYREIPFICEERLSFQKFFPDLQNRTFHINARDKGLYHALCVLGGNFTVMLWQKVFKEFEERLNLPREVLTPYFRQIFTNTERDSQSALTGPVLRNDRTTIKKNIDALEDEAWKNIYRAFDRTLNREEK